MGAVERTLSIGGAVLSGAHGRAVSRWVAGREAPLRSLDELARTALSTQDHVSTVLAELVPCIVAVPDAEGQVHAATMPAWAHYQALVQALNTPAAPTVRQHRARAVLAWCVLAHTLVVMTEHEEGLTPEFLAVEYLAQHGAHGAPLSVSNLAMGVTVPWVEGLGLDLGAGATPRALDLLSRVMRDAWVDERDGSRVEVASRHGMRFPPAALAYFLEKGRALAREGRVDCAVQVAVSGPTGPAHWSVRVQVHPRHDGSWAMALRSVGRG